MIWRTIPFILRNWNIIDCDSLLCRELENLGGRTESLRHGDSWSPRVLGGGADSLAREPNLLGEVQANERPCLGNKRDGAWETNHTQGCPLAPVYGRAFRHTTQHNTHICSLFFCMCVCFYMHTYMYNFTSILSLTIVLYSIFKVFSCRLNLRTTAILNHVRL